MKNIRLTMSFDGTDFHGYQIQPNADTIEEELKKVISKLTKENIKIIGCGRTDAGVHAYDYTANFKTNSNIPMEKLPIAINSNIVESISIKKAQIVDDDFHARYSAKTKTYVYRICNNKIISPFDVRYACKHGGTLDIKQMEKACKMFVGTHDFDSHRSVGTDIKNTIRTMQECYLEQNGDILQICMTANGFLYNMARTISGTILYCGMGKIAPQDIHKILESKDRTKAGPTLEAKGLFMKTTTY